MSTNRRDEILGVATGLFARHGFRHTTLDAIAGACGLGKTAIYHYFDGKQAIFAAAMDTISDNLIEQMRTAAAGTEEPVEAIVVAIRERFVSLRRLYENLGVPEEIAQELGRLSIETRDRFFVAEAELLQELIEKANASGACQVEDPAEMAAILSAMFRGIEGLLTEPRRIEKALETMEAAVVLVSLGLRATAKQA